MRKTLVIATILGLAVVALVAIAGPPLDEAPAPRPAAVSDLSQLDMAESHRPMMEQMRATAVPQMPSIMTGDPMWQTLSPEMVRLMEAQQADMDRMLGRR